MTYISYRRYFRRYGIFALPAAVIVIILILISTVVQPKISEVLKANEELASGKTKLAQLTKKVNTLNSLDKNDLKEHFNILDSAVPAEKDVPGLLLGVQRIANEASVSVLAIDISPGLISTESSKQTKKVLENPPLEAKVTIKGTFSAIRSFIDKASGGRRLLKMSGVSLGGLGAQKADSPITLTLSLFAFYQDLPTTLGDIASPVSDFTPEEKKVYDTIKKYPYYSYFKADPITLQPVASGPVPLGKIDLFNP